VLDATLLFSPGPHPVPVRIGTLDMEITLSRITHPSRPDILINPGSVYGAGLAALKADGNDVMTLSSSMTYTEILLLLFSKLGYATWKNPAFNARGQVTSLRGIYAVRAGEKLFVTRSGLTSGAEDFLADEGIITITLKGDAI
jgi:hypothetical protein